MTGLLYCQLAIPGGRGYCWPCTHTGAAGPPGQPWRLIQVSLKPENFYDTVFDT